MNRRYGFVWLLIEYHGSNRLRMTCPIIDKHRGTVLACATKQGTPEISWRIRVWDRLEDTFALVTCFLEEKVQIGTTASTKMVIVSKNIFFACEVRKLVIARKLRVWVAVKTNHFTGE